MFRGTTVFLRYVQRLTAARQGLVTDRELLERFAWRRDEEAFALLVERHGPMVLRVCRRVLASSHDAEDVFQATFVILARKARSVRWRDSVGNWLFGVAYNLARQARTAAARRVARPRPLARQAATDPLEELTARELLGALDEELASLPTKWREPLVLCFLKASRATKRRSVWAFRPAPSEAESNALRWNSAAGWRAAGSRLRLPG